MKPTKNLQAIAREVLLAEAEAIRSASECLTSQFDECVEAILTLTGRVVVTGVGKSALVGQKLVATLNSTGTPALFMHAADAIHGDLGMVQANDMVLAISKSGNTPEVKVLVPLIHRTGAQLIALVSEADSYLARQANFVLLAPVSREADPMNLAPTTSTTVAMALGDALAIALLTARGFTRQDFARYHPGGSLGKKLYLKVSDLFPHNQCPCVAPNQSIHDTMLTMSRGRLGATAVLDPSGTSADRTPPAMDTSIPGTSIPGTSIPGTSIPGTSIPGTSIPGTSIPGTLLGVITDGDVRRMVSQHDDYRHLCARDIMTSNPTCVAPDEYAVTALELMQQRNITQILVVDAGTLVGFVHLHDLLREGLV